MEIINPYAPPETHVSETRSHEGKGISWWYHFVIATFLLPVWFFVGFAISIAAARGVRCSSTSMDSWRSSAMPDLRFFSES